MLHIAIITGGPSAERSISEQSALLIHNELSKEKYTHRTILVEQDGWFEKETGSQLNLNDFSLTLNGQKENFDFAFLMIHGTPAEDGRIQGYLEMMGVPHSTCDTLSSALTFNKQVCKDFLKRFDIPMAQSVVLRKEADISLVKHFDFPVFVKPNKNGSSYGASKVDHENGLADAVKLGFKYDNEVMVEQYMQGREFGCGVVKEGEKLVAFPITELIPDEGHDFFDYEAKYLGKSQEITPAEISQAQTTEVQNLSKKLYFLLGCLGIVRFDYILKNGVFYLLEANTIPGMSAASIIPQQARAHGWTITHLLDVVVTDCMQK